MKKNRISTVFALSLLLVLSSCASIPKKVKPGDTLVIGRAEIFTHDYAKYNDIDLNGIFHSEMELTLKDMVFGKERIIKPNEDGCFYISGLRAHGTYGFTKVVYSVHNNDGSGVKMSVNISNPKTFIPYDNIVVNIGCTYYDFDGITNYVTWQTRNHYYVQQFYEDLDQESEWFDKEIVNQR